MIRAYRGLGSILVAMLLVGSWPADVWGQRGGPVDEARKVLADAVRYSKEGDKDDADAAFRKAVKLSPQFSDAYERYSLFLYAEKRYKDGAALMERGIKEIPDDKSLHGYLGIHLSGLGQTRRAYETFKTAENAIRERYELQVVFAQVASAMNDHERVVRAVQDYQRKRPPVLAKQDYVFETLAAEALARMGGKANSARAAKLLRSVLGANIFFRAARVARGIWLLRNHYCKRAVKAYKQMFKRTAEKYEEENHRLEFHLAEAYSCLDRHKDAEDTVVGFLQKHREQMQALLSNPNDPAILPILADPIKAATLLEGDSALELGKPDRALEAYRRALTLHEGSVPVLLRIARVFYQMKKYDDVLKMVQPTLATKDAPATVIALAVRASVRLHKKAEALEYANRLLKTGGLRKEHYYHAGLAFAASGKFDRATELFEKSDTSKDHVKKDLVRAYSYRAFRAMRAGGIKATFPLLSSAYKYGPDDTKVNRNLALYYVDSEKPDLALKHTTVVLAANTKDVGGNMLAARALTQKGEHSEALKHYTIAKKLFKGTRQKRANLAVAAALARLRSGDVDDGMRELHRSMMLSVGMAALRSKIERNIARGHLIRGQKYLERGSSNAAWKELNIALKNSNVLPEREAIAVRVLVALAALAAGKIPQAKRMIGRLRSKLPKVLKAPYDQIGYPLLMEYANAFSRSSKDVQRSATRIAALAEKVPEPAKTELKGLAGTIYSQLGVRTYRAGDAPGAIAVLKKARALAPRATTEMQHNLAVADYYAGRKAPALRKLQSLSRNESVALCNLAVNMENNGQRDKSQALFAQCAARGGRFPRLKEILAIKNAIFGKK